MFEILAGDLLGRIGRLRVKDKVAETPLFLPVINPVTQSISARWMKENLRAEAVITNAYIIFKRLRERALEEGVHGILDFDGIIMTDSGGYPVMEYGDVEAGPEEIALFEEEIGTDIAVPLDIPTGICGREKAEETVEKTLKNVEITLNILRERGIRRALWAAPIQGGTHLDLLQRCAELEKEMGFDLYALGSPTPLMEGYRFEKLFEMIYTVRRVIGFGRPLHLFGAGHPMIFPFIVALGVDMFDSASYYLYAKDERYITSTGTLRIDRIDYFPCNCPICSNTTPDELKELEREERVRLIATHNLYACFREIQEIKQAIRDGRLMELLEIRARSHPRLYQAFRWIMENEKLLKLMEDHTPLSSRRGINLFDELSLRRPRIRRARRRLMGRYFKQSGHEESLVLIPFNRRMSFEKIERIVGEEVFEVAYYGTPYGLIPDQLRYTYPFSQTNYPRKLIEEVSEDLVKLMIEQIRAGGYKRIHIIGSRSRYLRELASKLHESLHESGTSSNLIDQD